MQICEICGIPFQKIYLMKSHEDFLAKTAKILEGKVAKLNAVLLL